MIAPPWAAAQAAMASLGFDGVLLTGVAAQQAIGGHRRIRVLQSDPPAPAFLLTRSGSPHVCTPDPEGALHLPADHVHPIAFDSGAFARALPTWLGTATSGRLALDDAAPDAYAVVAAACPHATLVDAAPLLLMLGVVAPEPSYTETRDSDDLLQPRRAAPSLLPPPSESTRGGCAPPKPCAWSPAGDSRRPRASSATC